MDSIFSPLRILMPPLRDAQRVLPINTRALIAGFGAKQGIITYCFPGILRPDPAPTPRPFEVISETPGNVPMTQQVEAISCALQSVLKEYRAFIAQGANL